MTSSGFLNLLYKALDAITWATHHHGPVRKVEQGQMLLDRCRGHLPAVTQHVAEPGLTCWLCHRAYCL